MQLLKSDKIESRTYQEVIAASAISQNTLVVLPTGLGKTIIAAMVAANKAEEGKVLFLAPTKPLSEQHRSTFNEFLELPEVDLSLMTGDTRPDERYRLWDEKRIFFATPQVVENDLISGQVPVDEFSLVIFDEAHRATGEYSYVFISEKMRGVHRLALTASPGGTRDKIDEVSENLHIDNYEVRTEDDPDVEPYIEEKEVNWTKVSLGDDFEKAKESFEKAYQRQLRKLKKNGQIDSTNNVYKGQLLKLRGQISSKLSSTDDPKLYQSISLVATAIKISQAIERLETQGVSQCYSYVQGLENDDSKAAKRALADEDFQRGKNLVEYMKKKEKEHPKMKKLREVLGDLDEDEKAIVFTEYRDTTEKISEELREEGLKARRFIGQQGDRGMTQKEQAEVLEDFEDGLYDVIVSTSIGEEGLDIPAVDYVIFYEPVASEIRDIQRAGRTGRQESGEIYVLIAENTQDEGNYWAAHNKKKKMNTILKELKGETRQRKEKSLDQFSSKEDDEEDEDEEDAIEVVADDRENSINKKLSKMDIVLDQQRLDVADFIVSDRAAVERKEAGDFVDSIVDNRLFDQLNDMLQFDRPILLIEGDNLYKHRDIHPNAIRGALASISMDHQIPILWTDGEDDTAETLAALAKREQEEKDRSVAVRGSRSGKSDKEEQEFVVAGFPDVNRKLAERLLEEFGTIEKIFTASEEELKNVKGVGEKKASAIRSLMERNYND